ncbi:DUF4183 domain-containing protein [Oceanobacillus polygoni]|uniref:DUF4183 domain-containing protein n=1 Tax=Oceanobacillus polygoni TaxID=1235259 RepID=A0A9X0YU25_9BACI|nr:DUF4183 domain-containing protein [Oceanobacillus polygoni]MBP2078723.1 hypothetical protein [Oceanobacillus polygoni]
MALQLMKLFVSASTDTEVTPTVEKFFYVAVADTEPGDTLTIDAADFFDDLGAEVVELPELAENNSYYHLYINGVLQMQDISTYTPGATGVGSLSIEVPAGPDSILAGTPIVLEVVNFDTSSTTDITT